MKILKIELQNINSLKSEKPIIIDFESEEFKNTGLYAITGVTGAGKTTILDAITIALYREVPRFNKNKKETSLSDIVSYGASGAMARLKFENKNEIFEAHWSIRVKTKNGRELKQHQEKFILKNLTTEKIISETKNDTKIEIEKIIQLDYNQFLRSVMLAQGEFATFLLAGNTDKIKLLEQITGNEIYKKIGEETHNRFKNEEKKLDLIKLKIDNENLLSDEKLQEIEKEQIENSNEIKSLESELLEINKIISWYENDKKIKNKRQKLDENLKKLSENEEKNFSFIQALKSNEKAEIFKELINEISKNEKEFSNKDLKNESLNQELISVEKRILENKEQLKISEKLLLDKENDFKNWLPKLEKITKLDNEIKNFKNKKNELNFKIKEILKKIDILEKKNFSKEKKLKKNENEFKNIENNISLLNDKNLKISQILGKNNLNNLIDEKDFLEKNKGNLKEILNISENYTKHKSKNETLDIEKNELEIRKKELSENLENLSSEIKIAKTSLEDIEKILDLERKIKSFEEERKNLKKDEACILCGSKIHPLIENYKKIKVSETEKELKNRKKIFEDYQKNEKKLNRNFTEVETKLEINLSSIKENKAEIKISENEFLKLHSKFEIKDTKNIRNEIFNLDENLKNISKNINKINKFQKEKDKNIENLSSEKENLSQIKNEISNIKIEIKNDKNNLEEKTIEKENYQNEEKNENEKYLEIKNERKEILPLEISTKENTESLKKSEENAKKTFDKIFENYQILKTKKATKKTEIKNIKNEISNLSDKLKNLFYELDEKIKKSDFNSKSEIEENLLNDFDKKKYSKIQKELENKEIELKTLEESLSNDFENQEKEKDFEISFEELLKKKKEKEFSKNNFLKKEGEFNEKLNLDKKIKHKNKEIILEISTQEKIFSKWKTLKGILGDKNSFNAYVQRINLKNLIICANKYLLILNKRYSLEMNDYKEKEELNFKLIDHYQADEKRLVDTSSGGERFLISLSLALGLSDLASKNVKIDSLFIDEGFGTLDNNTLETVISSLETLEKEGKMIGIISHVENLKERISTQIQVLKKTNGVSEIKIF